MDRIIEINGIKMAVDERTATVSKVDTFKVGDPVKLLMKTYSGFDVKYAVLIGFDQFQKRPSISLAYLDFSELKFLTIHEGSEHEIAAVQAHDMVIEKDWILQRMQDGIVEKEQELMEAKHKLEHFHKFFGQYVKDGIPSSAAVSQ